MTDTTPQELLADRFSILTEDLKNELFDLYICPEAAQEEDDDDDKSPAHDPHNDNNEKSKLIQIAEELFFKYRSYNNSDALVEKGLLSQKQLDDAKMYLFLTKFLSTKTTTTTTYASLVESVRKCLVLATATGTTTKSQSSSLVLELLLDPRAVEQQLNPDEMDGTAVPGHHRLLDLPCRRYDEYGNAYVTGGLFDLQDCIQAMRRDISSCNSCRNDDDDNRPKKRRRVMDMKNDGNDNHETSFAQLSLAYILVAMVYDSMQQNQQQQKPVTVKLFLEEIQQLGVLSPVLNNAFLASNAPFWFLFDTILLLSSLSSGSNCRARNNIINTQGSTNTMMMIPTDLTLSFVQNELCNIRSSAIAVLKKACGSGVSEYALLARCGELIMDCITQDEEEATQVRTAIQNKLLRNWSCYLNNLVLKKQQKNRRILETATADVSGSPTRTTTWRRGTADRGGTKRSMQDVVDSNSSSINSSKTIDDPTLSLREMLAKPEYPLFILIKLLLRHRKLDEAILIVITMEKEDVFDFSPLYQAYKLLFYYLVSDGHLLFDTSNVVSPVQSLHTTLFPLVGRTGIHILALLHCGILERIQHLQTCSGTAAATPEQAFVRHSCLRALLRMLGNKYTMQEGLKHYEELRNEHGFAAVLDGPLSLERAISICQNECQLPASGFPDLAALLGEPGEAAVDEDERDVIAPALDDDHNVATTEAVLPIEAIAAVATPPAAALTTVITLSAAVATPPPPVAAATVHAAESDEEDEFFDAQQDLNEKQEDQKEDEEDQKEDEEDQQEDEEDQGYDAAEESQGEPQPEDIAMVDSTPLVQQPRQEETAMLVHAKNVNVAPLIPRREFDEGYDATAEESQGQDDVSQPPPTRKRVHYDADDSQGQTEEEEDPPTDTLKERKPEAISTVAVKPVVVAAASVQAPVASRPDDGNVNQDYGYDAEESQGHSDEEDVPSKVKHVASHQPQPDNGYDAEESQDGHMTEEGSVEFESASGQELTVAADRKHVAFAPVVQPVAPQPEDDPGYLPSDRDDQTEDEVAVVHTERDGYQGGESSVQQSEEEEEGSGAMPATDDVDNEDRRLAALDAQEEVEPSQPPVAHSLSDMDAADEQTMDREDDVPHESSDLDDDDDDDDDDSDGRHFPPSGPGGAVALGQRSSLHEYAAAAQDEYSPGNRYVRANNGQQAAPTPASRASIGRDEIRIDSDDTKSEDSSVASAAPESSSQPHQADYDDDDDEADEQEVDEEEEEVDDEEEEVDDEEEEVDDEEEEEEEEMEMESSAHSSPSPARKPSAYAEDYEHEQGDSSTYDSPNRQSGTGAHGDEDQQEGNWSTYSSPSRHGRASDDYGEEEEYDVDYSPERKQPAEEDHDVDDSLDRKQPAEETSLPTGHDKAAVDVTANNEDVEMAADETSEGPLSDTSARAESGTIHDGGVETVGKSSEIIEIGSSEDGSSEDDDSEEDTGGSGIANVDRDAVEVHEAGGPTADTTMDGAVAETANDSAPEEEEIGDKAGEGQLAGTRPGDEEAGGEPPETAFMDAGENQPQEETGGAISENVGTLQQATEVIDLHDDSTDDVEMDETGGGPLEEPAAAGADVNQDSAAAGEDVDVEITSAVQQQSHEAVELDDDGEMIKQGDGPGAATDANKDSAASPGAGESAVPANEDEDAGMAGIQRETVAVATIGQTIAEQSHGVVEADSSLGGTDDQAGGHLQDVQPATEDPAKPVVGDVLVEPTTLSTSGVNDEKRNEHADESTSVDAKGEAATGKDATGGDVVESAPRVDVEGRYGNETAGAATVDTQAEEAAGGDVVESAPTGDVEGRNVNETTDTAAVAAQAEKAAGEVKADGGEEEPHAVDLNEDQPQSKLTDDDENVQAGACKDGKEETNQAEGACEAGDAVVQAVEGRGLTNPLAPIPEREVVDDIAEDHAIREISTHNPTIVDEDIGVHPDGQDDDASTVGSDDEIGSRQSRSTRDSIGKRSSKVPQSPARKRQTGGVTASVASKKTPQRKKRGAVGDNEGGGGSIASNTRSSAKQKQSGSIASNTRSSAKKKPRGDVDDDDGTGSVASTTRSSAKKKQRGDVGDEDVKGGSISSNTRPSAKKKPRGDVDDDGGAGSIASTTRSSAKKKQRGDVGDDDGAGSIASNTRSSAKKKPRGDVGGDDGAESIASNTRAKGKGESAVKSTQTPRKSNRLPPRHPPSTTKKK